MRLNLRTCILCLVALLGLAAPGRAADNTWTNGGGAFTWNTGNNWTAPLLWNNNFFAADSAVFGAAGLGGLTLSDPTNVRSLNFGTNDGYSLAGGTVFLSQYGTGAQAAGSLNIGGVTGTATTTTVTVNSNINSSFGFTKIGDGVLALAGLTNNIRGFVPIGGSTVGANVLIGSATTTVFAGTFRVASATTLPATTSLALGHGFFDIGTNNVTLGSLIFANTTPSTRNATSQGVIGSGILTVTGPINIIGNTTGFGNSVASTINIPSGVQRVLVGSGSNAANEVAFNAPITGGGGLLKLPGVGTTGAVSLGGFTLAANNTYTGPTTIVGNFTNVITGTNTSSALTVINGVTTLQGASGSFGSATTVNAAGNGVVVLSNTANVTGGSATPAPAAGVFNRLNTGAAVNLTDGTLTLTANATPGSQTVASVNSNLGFNRINLEFTPGGSSTITAGSLTTGAGSTLVLGGSALGTTATVTPLATAFVVTGALPTIVNGIIPGVYGAITSFGSPVDFVTNSASFGVGLVTLAAGDYLSNAFAAASNSNISTAQTLTASASSNAFKTSVGVTINTGFTLNVGAGGILTTAAVTIAGPGTLAFGANPAVLVANSTTTIYSAPITGTAGLVRSGAGAVTLSGDLSGLGGTITNVGTGTLNLNTATFTGPINLRGGTLTSTVNIGAGGLLTLGNPNTPAGAIGPFTSAGFNITGVATVARNVATVGGDGTSPFGQTSVGNSITTLAGVQAFTGTFNLASPLSLSLGSAASVITLGGVVSGAGALEVNGSAGTLALTNAGNTFTGGVRVNVGTLIHGTAGSLGTGPIRLNGGTLRTDIAGGVNGTGGLTVLAGSTLNTNGNAVTIAGGINGENSSATLTKSGAGILSLTGDGSFPGTFTLSAVAGSGVNLGGANGRLSNVATLNVLAGTSLTLDNTAAYNADRIRDTATINMANSLFSYVAPATGIANPAEVLGNLANTTAGSIFSVTGSAGAPAIIRIGNYATTAAFTFRGTGLGTNTGNFTRILLDNFTTNVNIIPNTFFANTPGTTGSPTAAGYDLTLGVIQFVPTPVSGTTIRNASPTNTTLSADFTTTGTATAVTGTSIYALTLDGGTGLTISGGDAASGTNANTPDGTLLLSGGFLTAQNGTKTITSATAQTVSFGTSLGTVTTTSDLSFAANVTLAGTGGLTKAGAGVLTLSGPYAVTGPTTISAGTLAFTAPVTLSDLSGTGTLNVGANALTVNAANPTTFGGVLTSTSTLTKTGTAAFTFAPTNTPAITATSIANGTLLLGSTGGAAAVFNGFSLGDGVANTPGTLDLNGVSPPSTLTSLSLNGTSTGSRLINSNATLSAFTFSVPTDLTLAVGIGGNITMTKTGAGNLTLTGSVSPPATTTGQMLVTAGTLTMTNVTPVGTGMSLTAGPAGTVSFGSFGTNSGLPFGAINSTGGAIIVTGGSGDLFTNSMTFTGGSLSFAGTTNFWWHFVGAGAAITTNASANPVTFTGVTGGSRIQNDNATLLPITVADGAAAVDLDANTMVFNVGTAGFNKLGTGTMRMAAATNSAAFTINAGTLLLDVGGATSGATTVNSGGRFVANGNTTNIVTVNVGGRLGGTGNIVTAATSVIAGTIAPGNSAGTLTFGSGATATAVTLTNGTYAFEMQTVNAPAALLSGASSPALPHNNHDVINIFGTVNVNGMVVNVSSLTGTGFDNTQTYSWLILQSTGTLTGTPILGTVSGTDFASLGTGVFQLSVQGNTIILDFNPVPEPTTVFGLSALVLGGGFIRRRLRKSAGTVVAA